MCQRTHAWLSEPSKRGSLDSQSSRHVVIVRHPQQSPAEPVSRGPLWTRGWIEATQNTNWGINKGTLWNGLALYRKWGSSRYCIHCAQKARKDRSTHQQLALLAHEPRDWEGICHISFFKKRYIFGFCNWNYNHKYSVHSIRKWKSGKYNIFVAEYVHNNFARGAMKITAEKESVKEKINRDAFQ